MKRQNEEILNYLSTHKKGLTTLDMMLKLGIASPAKRIQELRRDGHSIIGIQHKKRNRYGRMITFLEYRLAK